MRILLIEENELLMQVMKDFLEETGHKVISASSVETALEETPSGGVSPDLVIFDPGARAAEAGVSVEKAEQAFPESGFLLTALKKIDRFAPGMEGKFSFMKKPVRLSELETFLAKDARLEHERVLLNADRGRSLI